MWVRCLSFWQPYSSRIMNKPFRLGSENLKTIAVEKFKIDIATYLPNENDFPDSNRTNRNCSTTCSFHLKTFHRSIVNKTDNREHNSRSSGIEKKTEQESISINVWLSCGRTGEYTWCAMHSGRP